MTTYDIVAIGGGSGGIGAMNRAGLYGAKAAVIEGQKLGGTCVNKGCVPKKIMWYGAQIAEALHKYGPSYGFEISQETFDFSTLKQNREAYIDRARNSYANSFKNNGVELIEGWASFKDANTLLVNGQEIKAKNIVIATGAKPVFPSIPGAELGDSSDQVFEWDELPQSVAIVGAGYIAVELAGVLNALGVQTDLFIRRDRPLRSFDHSIIETLMDEMTQSGIGIHTHKEVQSAKKKDEDIALHFRDGSQFRAQKVIWAIGRKPNLDGLNLEAAGVELNDKGYIKVDAFQETSTPHIFAIGDVTGQKELTPVAIRAGRLLAERLFNGQKEAKVDYSNIPTVIFSHPAIGTIGYSEEEAIKEFGPNQIKVYQSNFASMYSAVSPHREQTRLKLVTLGPEERIIGLHGIGYGVDEMIQGFAVAIKMGATKADFDATIAIHPTGSEEFVTMR